MSYCCPQCSKPTLPPAVNPASYRLCAKCGHRFDPDHANPQPIGGTRMTIEETYTEAAERYERLYWAVKAKRALSKCTTRQHYGPPPALKEGEVIGYVTDDYTYVRHYRSSIPGTFSMSDWERGVLERQRDIAPLVEPGDVKRAREHMNAAKKGMKAALKAREREAVKRAKRERETFAPVEFICV